MDECTLETITTIVDRLCLVFCVLLVTQLLSNIATSQMATAWAQNRYFFLSSYPPQTLTPTNHLSPFSCLDGQPAMNKTITTTTANKNKDKESRSRKSRTATIVRGSTYVLVMLKMVLRVRMMCGRVEGLIGKGDFG